MQRYFKQERKMIIVIAILLIISRLAYIQIARMKGTLIDEAIHQGNFQLIFQIGIFLFLILLNIGIGYLFSLLRFRTVQRIYRNLKNDIFQKTLSQSRINIRNLDRANIINKYTTELDIVVNNYLTIGGRVIEILFELSLSLIAMLLIDIKITIIAILIYTVPVLATKSQQRKLSNVQESYMIDAKTHVGKFMSYIKSLELIKNYHIEQDILKVYDSSLGELKKSALKRARIQANTNGLSSVLTFFAQGIIALFCAYQLFQGKLSVGGFITIFSLSSTLSEPIYWLARLVEAVLSSKPAVKSIIDYLNHAEDEPKLRTTNGEKLLHIENLHFSYAQNKILENINLSIEKNKKILIVGKSGSGKSTLISLIMSYLQPQEGNIYYADNKLEKLVCLSSQDSFLFEDNLIENLFHDDTVECRNILLQLGLHDIIDRQNGNFELSEKGKNVSGGQKKRIALCRSFLQKTPLLILDEPLANIDPENIHLIEEYILNIQDQSLIIISHQVSSALLDAMDDVYILQDRKLMQIKKENVAINQEEEYENKK